MQMEENKNLNNNNNNQILNENKDILFRNLINKKKNNPNSKKKKIFSHRRKTNHKVAHGEKKQKFNLYGKGYIINAKIHSSANRPLHKINNLTEKVEFCPCCNLPSYTKGILEHFSYCSPTENFSECGVGIYLYFFYLKFAIFMLCIATCIAAIPMIIMSEHYTRGINTVCEKLEENKIENKNCLEDPDWALRFRVDNIKNYRELFQDITEGDINDGEVDNVILNYSIVNFFCLITLFGVNIGFIIMVNAKSKQIDILNVSPSDYTLFCTNLKNSLQAFNYFKKLKGNEKYNDPSKTENENFKLFLKEQLLEDEGKNLNIESINLCYKLEEFMEIENEIQSIAPKIFQINNNPNMVLKNKDIENENEKLYYEGILCCKKIYTFKELNDRKTLLEEKLKNLMDNTTNINEQNFSGSMFVTFKTINDAENFYNQFPQDFLSKSIEFIKNLKYYICCCCISKQKVEKFHRRKKMKVYVPAEPEDVIWENLDCSFLMRFKRMIIVYSISFLLIGISFGIVLSLTYLQDYSNDHKWSSNILIKYSVSILITCVISVLNTIFQSVLGFLTFIEKHISKTDHQLSFSIKLTIFTFANSGLVPLFSNYIQNGWRENEILVNNMLMMFLINAFVTPFMWTFNFFYFYKKIQIYLIERKENPDQHHHYIQKELNDLYELPTMDIFYKYSYIGKTLLMSFFYIPIFPLGVPISLVGFILAYFLEKFNFIHMYKRPEMLNQNICVFYINNFIVILFCYSIGCFLFMNDVFPHNKWTLSNLILFGLLCFIPYSKFLKVNLLGVNEGEINKKSYNDMYINFFNDYERNNPITKKEGIIKFLQRLKDNNQISERIYHFSINHLDHLNIMSLYYNNQAKNDLFKIQQGLSENKKNAFMNRMGLFLNKTVINKENDKPKENNNYDSAILKMFGNNPGFQMIVNKYNQIEEKDNNNNNTYQFGFTNYENVNNNINNNNINNNNINNNNINNFNNNGNNNNNFISNIINKKNNNDNINYNKNDLLNQYNNPFFFGLGFNILNNYDQISENEEDEYSSYIESNKEPSIINNKINIPYQFNNNNRIELNNINNNNNNNIMNNNFDYNNLNTNQNLINNINHNVPYNMNNNILNNNFPNEINNNQQSLNNINPFFNKLKSPNPNKNINLNENQKNIFVNPNKESDIKSDEGDYNVDTFKSNETNKIQLPKSSILKGTIGYNPHLKKDYIGNNNNK